MKNSLALILFVATCAGCSTGRRAGGRGGSHDAGPGGGTSDAGPSGTDGGSQQDGSSCTVDQPQSAPLALPDTNASNGTQTSCKTDADCGGSTPRCVITADKDPSDGGPGFCVASYVDSLNFVGFGAGATLTDTSKLISVCATLEHSWFGDLQIDLISPDGKIVSLRQFIGRDLGNYFLGHPNYCDTDAAPVAGKGYKYCWTASASTKILKPSSASLDGFTCGAAGGCESWDGSPLNTCSGGDPDAESPYPVIPAGNYLPDVDFSALQGAQLNGTWQFRITDLWQVDNGFLFDWSIEFDSSLVADCSVIIN
ncbi:MAG: proprotein convertase P-domain-containing protein [Polyangia bacterium]